MSIEASLAAVVAWAREEPSVQVVLVTGSVARNEHDELSDLDVELYVTDQEALLSDHAWWRGLGDVLAVEILENPGWHPTRLVHYVGAKVDFMIAPLDALPAEPHSRAVRVVLDKTGSAAPLVVPDSRSTLPPTADEFDRVINEFWAAVLMWARCAAWKEPWLVKVREWDAMANLLTMIEWDHRAAHGWDAATWFRGKHLDRWCAADVRAALDSCWAPFDPAGSMSALHAVADLFARLATRVADAAGYSFPAPEPVLCEVRRILG